MEEKYIELLLKKCTDPTSKVLFIHYKKEIATFIQKLIKRAKELGTEEIYLDQEDPNIIHDLLKNHTKEEIESSKYFDKSIWDKYAKRKANFLIFETEYPNLMNDVSDEMIAFSAKISRESKPLYRKMVEKCELSWCIAAYPSVAWAEDIIPGENSYERLKELIFKVCMVDQEDPLASWDRHLTKIENIMNYLNKLNLSKLHYSNSLGTSLDVYLPKKYHFDSAKDGKVIVNMPSYEIFASPIYNKTEGIVYSSKPLNYNGKIINDFWIRFHEGKAVEYDAKEGKEVLKSIIESDSNSCYLGECALVEYNSPISNLNVIFKTTLIDENASSHLALGAGFAECLDGGLELADKELLSQGINVSKQHVDFMIGTPDLKIVATTKEGREVVIFENGNFSKERIQV